MSENDAWVLKSFMGRNPWLVTSCIRRTRAEVVEYWRAIWGEKFYKKYRNEERFKIVRVRLVEVE